jgi:hypothetical protein
VPFDAHHLTDFFMSHVRGEVVEAAHLHVLRVVAEKARTSAIRVCSRT